MNNLTLIMPMAGAAKRFFDNGYVTPKPLLQLLDKEFYRWATDSALAAFPVSKIYFVIQRSHCEMFNLDKHILKNYPEAKIIQLDAVLPGPVHSVLKALPDISGNPAILINDCDHAFKSEPVNENFLNNNDAAVLSFNSNLPHFSYIGTDEDGSVNNIVEKKVISSAAVAGCYYFKEKVQFQKYSQRYLENLSDNEAFISGVIKNMINDEAKVNAIPTLKHMPFGTPDEFKVAEELIKEW